MEKLHYQINPVIQFIKQNETHIEKSKELLNRNQELEIEKLENVQKYAGQLHDKDCEIKNLQEEIGWYQENFSIIQKNLISANSERGQITELLVDEDLHKKSTSPHSKQKKSLNDTDDKLKFNKQVVNDVKNIIEAKWHNTRI